jgi:heme oxygenase|tara:strand:+ start:505 stop:1074 length:570 start_codon:yes stop_codon:yes gene_type:complete
VRFATGFLRSLSSVPALANFLGSLYFVYEAIERLSSESTHPAVQKMHFPELHRMPPLAKDMEYFFGDEWKSSLVPSEATLAYVSRIEEVAREKPYLLVSHMFTRYLGDLFGGRMMAPMVRTSLSLPPEATHFYVFEEVPNPKAFIDTWYTQLNTLELSEAEQQEMVDEANRAFRWREQNASHGPSFAQI